MSNRSNYSIRAMSFVRRAKAMTRRKSTGRPKRLRGVKSNMVAAAVELAGEVTAVAKLCGVARQSVYTWIEDWRVERLIDALKLARASGIPDRAPGRETRLSQKAFQVQNHRSHLASLIRIANRKSPAPDR
jgi:transposase-like protein